MLKITWKDLIIGYLAAHLMIWIVVALAFGITKLIVNLIGG